MRNLRQEVKAEARISSELAGTDTRLQEAEFLEYARSTSGSDEFEALVGLAEETDTATKDDAEPPVTDQKDSALPE